MIQIYKHYSNLIVTSVLQIEMYVRLIICLGMEKTAKRILQDSDVRISADSGMGERITDLMKEYARQIATNALKDAAENVIIEYMTIQNNEGKPDVIKPIVNKESITKTEIKLP